MCICLSLSIYIYVCVYIHIMIYVCMYVCMYVRMYVHIYIYIYTYLERYIMIYNQYMYIHIYIYIYIFTVIRSSPPRTTWGAPETSARCATSRRRGSGHLCSPTGRSRRTCRTSWGTTRRAVTGVCLRRRPRAYSAAPASKQHYSPRAEAPSRTRDAARHRGLQARPAQPLLLSAVLERDLEPTKARSQVGQTRERHSQSGK